MGEFIEQIKRRKESPVAIAHRISLHISSSNQNALIVEGSEDVHFYATLCRRVKPTIKPDFFVANGRSKVIETLGIVKSLGKISRCFGIVDRDFNLEDDESLYDGHCIVLDVYSFENYFADEGVLIEIGKNSFALEGGTLELQRWAEIVKNFITTLPNIFGDQHACAFWCRKNGINCYLENFDPCANLSADDRGNLSENPGAFDQFVSDAKVDTSSMRKDEIIELLELLRTRGYLKFFRGHYFWRIFTMVLNRYRLWLDDEFRRMKHSRARTRSDLSERHALESSCQFVNVPERIEAFLESVGR